MCFSSHREKEITLNIPIRAYVDDEVETTNNELLLQLHEPQTDAQCQEANRYQTHIVKIQGQPQFVDLPPESLENGRAQLKRMSSEDYANFVAGFGKYSYTQDWLQTTL